MTLIVIANVFFIAVNGVLAVECLRWRSPLALWGIANVLWGCLNITAVLL